MDTERDKNDSELLERIEAAARRGAEKGAKKNISLWSIIRGLLLLVILAGVGYAAYQVKQVQTGVGQLFEIESAAEEHDLVLEDNGLLGYTVADFQDAILGDTKQLKKLEVYSAEVSDLASITQTGIIKIAAFTKCQFITYHGYVNYTVDLGKLTKDCITLDEEKMVVTLKIPHAVQEDINIPSDEMEFGDVKKGILAIGDVKVTPEELTKVQSEAQKKMETKLEEMNTQEEADRFAKMSVWEIYQPMISGVAGGYTIEVEFIS